MQLRVKGRQRRFRRLSKRFSSESIDVDLDMTDFTFQIGNAAL